MLIRRTPSIKTSEITAEPLYCSRREFMRTAGSGAAAALLPFDRLPHDLLPRPDVRRLQPLPLSQEGSAR